MNEDRNHDRYREVDAAIAAAVTAADGIHTRICKFVRSYIRSGAETPSSRAREYSRDRLLTRSECRRGRWSAGMCSTGSRLQLHRALRHFQVRRGGGTIASFLALTGTAIQQQFEHTAVNIYTVNR
eukprot:GHVU01059671.1.p1 GENE.GHVU01059671.1~~GHVU01059671.1.p1  ORF type:complete len:126 (+),score=6.78 GHVU01059671.1:367-744(+)